MTVSRVLMPLAKHISKFERSKNFTQIQRASFGTLQFHLLYYKETWCSFTLRRHYTISSTMPFKYRILSGARPVISFIQKWSYKTFNYHICRYSFSHGNSFHCEKMKTLKVVGYFKFLLVNLQRGYRQRLVIHISILLGYDQETLTVHFQSQPLFNHKFFGSSIIGRLWFSHCCCSSGTSGSSSFQFWIGNWFRRTNC